MSKVENKAVDAVYTKLSHEVLAKHYEDLIKERDQLRQWKTEALMVFGKIFTFDHPELKLGESRVECVLRLARERDALKLNLVTSVAALNAALKVLKSMSKEEGK